MSDLYHIPHDDGKEYRLNKFVEYQHEVPAVCYWFLREWIIQHNIEKNRALYMCWYMTITYNEITAIIIDRFVQEGMSYSDIWKWYKPVLNFGADEKYIKNNDRFVPLMNEWNKLTDNMPYKWLKSMQEPSEESTYINVQGELKKLKYVGRFTSNLFMEQIAHLQDYFGIKIKEPLSHNWDDCSNLTSGIFNIFYEDEKANIYDKQKFITKEDMDFLTKKLDVIKHRIEERYPEQDSNVAMFIGKICSFRNLFKNARYGGFHHDRELGVIHAYEASLPQYYQIYNDCYKLRRQIFPDRFLGELHGWTGIRKERKKMWLRTGLTGAEPDGH